MMMIKMNPDVAPVNEGVTTCLSRDFVEGFTSLGLDLCFYHYVFYLLLFSYSHPGSFTRPVSESP